MGESENPLLNGFWAAQPTPPEPAPIADQCLKPTLDACTSFNRKRIADNGIQTSSDAKRVARSAKMPQLSNKNRTLSSNTLMSSEQEIECGGASMNLVSGFLKQKQFKEDILCRLISCDTRTKGRKRSQSSLGLPTFSLLKGSERSSPAKRRPSSIDDLPDVALVEILCRLPSSKFVFQCQSVSKHWRTVISDPYFIGRFVHIQSYRKTPKILTLISKKGEEFPPKMPWPSKLLTPVFERIMSFHPLIRELVVVATYNDLVLCCASEYYQCNYYICNAYTRQWVALPPAPSRCHETVQVGFICDIPDYNYKKDGHSIQLKAECRCNVVRLLPPDELAYDEKCDSLKLSVEIFSSETGEWKESVVTSPLHFNFHKLDDISFAYNGMLYWNRNDFFFVGLGPFNDNDITTTSSSCNGDDVIDHKLRFTVFKEPLDSHFIAGCLGVFGGCVRMCDFNVASKTLYVWELKEQDHDRMVNAAAGKLCVSNHRIYHLDPETYPDDPITCTMQAFDPNNEDILYLRVDGDIIKCNIHTREWCKIVRQCPVANGYYYRIVLPWWPTPVPRLPEHAHHGGTSS
ncbi:hypothetical protein ACE6H2_009617 [Prunus campanulata]